MINIIKQIKKIFLNIFINTFTSFDVWEFNSFSNEQKKESYLKENIDWFKNYLRSLDLWRDWKIILEKWKKDFIFEEDIVALKKIFLMIDLNYWNEISIDQIHKKLNQYLWKRQEIREETQIQNRDLQHKIVRQEQNTWIFDANIPWRSYDSTTLTYWNESKWYLDKDYWLNESVNEDIILDYNKIKDEFNELSWLDRERLQLIISTKPDWIFWKNTFYKLKEYININFNHWNIPSLHSILNYYIDNSNYTNKPELILEKPEIIIEKPNLRVQKPKIILEEPTFKVKPPKYKVKSPKYKVKPPKLF